MTSRRVLAALAVAVVLIVAAVVLEVTLPGLRKEREEKRTILWSGRGDFAAFSIERDGQTWRFEPRDGGGWILRASGVAKDLVADMRGVDDVKRALSGFGGIRTVLAEDLKDVPDLAQHGLAEPRLRLRWIDHWGRPRTLALGNVAPGGSQVAAIVDGERLVLVPRELREAVDRDLAIFRAKQVVALEWSEIERIDIERRRDLPPGASPRIVLERRHDDDAPAEAWRLVEPLATDANGPRAGSLVSKLASLMAGGFGAEEPAPEDLAAAGLSPAAVSITLTLAAADGAQKAPIVLDIGDAAGDKLVWCWPRTGPLVHVREDLRADLLLADDFYRDNRVIRLPRWNLVNVRIDKGVDKALEVEMQKDDQGAWRLVGREDAPIPQDEAEKLLDLLEGVRCGRFEDEMSGQPGSADARWDFGAPGSLRIRASALLPDGTPLRVDLDATPFKRDGALFYAVRTIDHDMEEEVCIAQIKAFDGALDQVRSIVGAAALATPAPAHD